MQMIHFVYKTTCTANGKYYIGMHSTDNENDGYLGSGTILKKAVSKYGLDSFEREILSYHESREAVISAETEFLKLISLSDSLCYNILKGGKRHRGRHDEDIKVFKVNFERNSDKYYHFTTIGDLYEKRNFNNKIMNTLYSIFNAANDRLASDLSSLFNDKKNHKLAMNVLQRIRETADNPHNLVITEMDWECAIISTK